MKDEWSQQLRLGARIFSGLVVGAVAVGWLMFVIGP
jgi:hypothetical protein